MYAILFIIAGVTTSTSTIHSMLIIMLNYPDVQTRIQNEIGSVIGRGRAPCLKDRSEMPYTEAVMLEVNRFFSFTPVTAHRCMDAVVFRGYTISKGCMVHVLAPIRDLH
jgi:cytochrome P450 family 2 subfamily U polypeptide 1